MKSTRHRDFYGIFRQGVPDLLKRCDKILSEYEEKLHLVVEFQSIKDKIRQIDEVEDFDRIRRLTAEIMEEL